MNTAIRTNATKAASDKDHFNLPAMPPEPPPAPPCPPHGIRLRSSYRRGRRHRTWLAVDQLQRRPALRRGITRPGGLSARGKGHATDCAGAGAVPRAAVQAAARSVAPVSGLAAPRSAADRPDRVRQAADQVASADRRSFRRFLLTTASSRTAAQDVFFSASIAARSARLFWPIGATIPT